VSRRVELLLITLILLLATGLRVYRLKDLPPGWRDDEIVETTVHAQLVLEGKAPLYFPQAEGHEPLYHFLSAGLIALAGRSLFVVRLLSVFFGVFSLAALYRLARKLFGAAPALIATLALSVSFWSLMYSRFKLRHISEVGLMLLTYYFFVPLTASSKPLRHRFKTDASSRPEAREAGFVYNSRRLLADGGPVFAAVCLSLCLYTYFAARVVPLILLAFVVYLMLFHGEIFRARRRSLALTFAVTAILTAPLAWAILRTPGGETRLSIVGRPLVDLLHGDPTYFLSNARETLGLFAFTGDPEYLYNIPNRPVFEGFGALVFLAGLLICLWRWREPPYAFLLIWLCGGLAPAFLSTPAASLSHTLAAQPVVYLIPAIALASLPPLHPPIAAQWVREKTSFAWAAMGGQRGVLFLLGTLLFIALTAARDLPDYFIRWPALPQVRYLYRADLHEAAAWLKSQPFARDLALSSRELNQDDVTALQLETPGLGLRPRLFDPGRALVYPAGVGRQIVLRQSASERNALIQNWPPAFTAESFSILEPPAPPAVQPSVPLSASFTNGLTGVGYTLTPEAAAVRLTTYWRVDPTFTPLPPRPIEILSGSPIPLKIFSHLLNPDGSYLSGDDRLDVDPSTLQANDQFMQLFEIPLPAHLAAGNYPVEIGLYDPITSRRLLLLTGEDHLTLTTLTLPP